MPRLIVMSTAVGSLALAPSAWSVTPCESSALAVGSVIFAVSPWTWSPKSAVNEALFTVAILASLSLTIWSADWPEAAVAAAELAARRLVAAAAPRHGDQHERQHEEQHGSTSGVHGTHRIPPVVCLAR